MKKIILLVLLMLECSFVTAQDKRELKPYVYGMCFNTYSRLAQIYTASGSGNSKVTKDLENAGILWGRAGYKKFGEQGFDRIWQASLPAINQMPQGQLIQQQKTCESVKQYAY